VEERGRYSGFWGGVNCNGRFCHCSSLQPPRYCNGGFTPLGVTHCSWGAAMPFAALRFTRFSNKGAALWAVRDVMQGGSFVQGSSSGAYRRDRATSCGRQG
jgi:hypothetical protein